MMFNKIVLIPLIFLASYASAEYSISNGVIHYTATLNVSYSLGNADLETSETLAAGEVVTFILDQRAVFRSEKFKESFVPVRSLVNQGAIFSYAIPEELSTHATLYQFFGESGSVCRLLISDYIKNERVLRFITKLKQERIEVLDRNNYLAISCRA